MAFGDLPFKERLEIVRAAESWNLTVDEFIDLKSGEVNPRVLNQLGIEPAPQPEITQPCTKNCGGSPQALATAGAAGPGLGGLGILVLLYLLWRR